MQYQTDVRGQKLTGASAAGRAAYVRALAHFNLYRADPVADTAEAIATDPGFVMAHALNAWLHLLGTAPAGVAIASASVDAVRGHVMTDQERGHIAAIEQLAAGQWHAASRIIEDVSVAYPFDLLALQAGHQIDFFTGNARMLRDRIARALPAWSADTPGYHVALGMHAFGLEEAGDWARAEAQGRRAIEIEPRDGWAQHAVAHVMEMQGRTREGIAWMSADPDAWAKESFFAPHNWWHLALYHLELGEIDEVLGLYDGPIFGRSSTVMMELIDAAAMLWRLSLRGVDVGRRWDAVADGFALIGVPGRYAFNDFHAMMAAVGAGRTTFAAEIEAAQREAMARGDDNARFTRDVGLPLIGAIAAFGAGRYAEVVRLIRPVRAIAARFGGSNAQRDVIDLTLIEAALRSQQHDLARALAAERMAAKPDSPLARLFQSRTERARLVA
jgi:hypothetical protein